MAMSVQRWNERVQAVSPLAYDFWSKKWERRDAGYLAFEWQNYPLEASAAAGHEATVKLLLDKKEEMRILDDEVMAALRGAARNGHRGVVEILCTGLPPQYGYRGIAGTDCH